MENDLKDLRVKKWMEQKQQEIEGSIQVELSYLNKIMQSLRELLALHTHEQNSTHTHTNEQRGVPNSTHFHSQNSNQIKTYNNNNTYTHVQGNNQNYAQESEINST